MSGDVEYILDNQSSEKDVQPLGEEELKSFSDTEREVLTKMEDLSVICTEHGIPCFLCAKFETQDNASAAWNFGPDLATSFKNFFDHFAALFLHVTSKMTQTTIVASNPKSGEMVYKVEVEVDPNSKSPDA